MPAEEVLPRARAIAADVAKTPRETLQMKKAQLNSLMDAQGFRRALDEAAMVHTILDFSESVRDMRSSIRDSGLKETVAKWSSQAS